MSKSETKGWIRWLRAVRRPDSSGPAKLQDEFIAVDAVGDLL